MNITILGAGNVAWHLAQAFEKAGHNVMEVYARNRKNAKKIASLLYDSDVTNSLDLRDSDATVFVLAVSDKAIEDLAKQILLPANSLLVHSSGSVPLEVLEYARKKNKDLEIGVLYPLMTFTTGKNLDINQVPFLIEGSDEKLILKIAKSLSVKCQLADSLQRQTLHAAAVFACNFTNHLLALAKELTENEEVDYNLLKPLISETLKKSLLVEHPGDVQTGPAVRHDLNAIAIHRDLLKDNDQLLSVYDKLTESIQYWHGE